MVFMREPVLGKHLSVLDIWKEWFHGLNGNPALSTAYKNHKCFHPNDKEWHRNMVKRASERGRVAKWVQENGGGEAGVTKIYTDHFHGKVVGMTACLKFLAAQHSAE